MNKSKVLNWVITIWSIFVLLGAAIFVLEKTRYLFVVDSDVLWHIKTGDFILANGYVPKVDVFSWHKGLNWIPHEWLYDVILSIIHSAFSIQGILIVALLLLIGRIAFVTIYNVLVKKENIQGYSIFVACLLILVGYTWAVGRPLELTMIIIMANLLVFIKKRKSWVYYLSLGISGFLVSNLHGGAIWSLFAPIIIMLTVDIAYWWKNKDNKTGKEHLNQAKTKLIAIIIGIIASLINPHGISVYDYFVKMFFTNASKATNTIAEWQPITFINAIASLIYVSIFIAFAFNKKIRELDKEAITKLLIISFWGVGMLSYCRLTPVFLFTVLLWGYEFIKEFIMHLVKSFKLHTIFSVCRIIVTILGLCFIILTTVMWVKWFSYYFTRDEKELLSQTYPYEGIRYLKDHNIRDKIYNDDWGSWMIYNDIPTFVDGRCDPFVNEFSPGNNQYIEEATAETLDDYLTIFRKYDIKYVFIKYDKDLKSLLEGTGDWETVVQEQGAMLLKRKDI